VSKINRINPIPITKHNFSDEAIQNVVKVIKSGWLVQGPLVREFEKLFCEFTGARNAVATTSCTTALHLSLIAAGIKKGDMVVVPAFTFVATANAVEYIEAVPVFCDIDINTFNISIDHLETILRKFRQKIKAVIPVHLFGLCANMEPIIYFSQKYGFKIIEDAACAVGARYQGKHAGTIGMMGCFSFHPRKIITTGEGGMITVSDDKLAEKLRSLRDHGASKSDLSRHKDKKGSLLPEYNIVGYNYRLTDIQAALGVAQMKKINSLLTARQTIARRYNELLKVVGWLKTPDVPENCVHSYQSYVCLVSKNYFGGKSDIIKVSAFRDKVMRRLFERYSISTRQGTHAVHLLGYYSKKYGLKPMDFPLAFEADKLTLALPLYADLSYSEQKKIINGVLECAALPGY